MSLTEPQARALRYLDTVEWASPATLGQALSDRKWISAQGCGRLGGTMATRLMRLGLVSDHWQKKHRGWHRCGYKINEAGKAAIAAWNRREE